MRKLTIVVLSTALLLSGCAGSLIGSGIAPVPTVTPTVGGEPGFEDPPIRPTVTPTPTAVATKVAIDTACRGDKISTINEVGAAGPQRIEVTTTGTIHLDYYSDRGVPSVSVIVQAGESAVLKGFGSMWQWGPECATYDFVKDATEYARARRDWGHSGVVYASLADFLAGRTPIANLWNLTNIPRPVLWDNKGSQVTTTVPGTPMPTTAAVTGTCPEGVKEDHPPVVNQPWTPKGEWRIVNFWTNQPGKDQKERKLLLKPTDNVSLLGGGTSWSFPASCSEADVQKQFVANGKPDVTLDQLRADGLVK